MKCNQADQNIGIQACDSIGSFLKTIISRFSAHNQDNLVMNERRQIKKTMQWMISIYVKFKNKQN